MGLLPNVVTVVEQGHDELHLGRNDVLHWNVISGQVRIMSSNRDSQPRAGGTAGLGRHRRTAASF